MSIKSGQILNRQNLNAAFVSKLDDNNILGNISTVGSMTAASISASGQLSGATLSLSGNATIGGILGITGLLTASAGVEIPAGQNYTVGGVPLSATFFGLGNVTNESKTTMFASPAFTGVPTAPTASLATNTTQVATTAYVKGQGYITQLFDDTSPQLSANLDINGYSLTTSNANGNVILTANGTGKVNATTDALFDKKVMIGNVTTYLEKDALTDKINTPNSVDIGTDLYLSTDTGRIYLGAINDAVISRGGASIIRIGDGTSANNLSVANGYLSVSTANVSEKLNIGGSIYMEGSIKYNDVSRYWLSTADNWGLYWNTTDNAVEFHGAGGTRASIDLDNGNSSFSGTLTASGKLTTPSADITSSGLKVSTSLGGDGGWVNGIVVENTAAVTGEASIAFKNAGTNGTGANYWFAGLNGGTSLDFSYADSFVADTKMSLDNLGNLNIAGSMVSEQDMYVGTNKVWHFGNLAIEPIEVFYEEFTATEGQTLFNLTLGTYPLGMKLLTVYIWGSKQPPSGFTETTTSSFTLAQGVAAGTKVMAEWFRVSPTLKGEKGDPSDHEWLGTELRFRVAGGLWGEYTNLKGDTGNKPGHEWLGTDLRFQNADDSWGTYVNLKGQQGIQGVAATVNLGTIAFIEPSETGYVTNIGNANDAIFNMGIPKGSTVELNMTPVQILNPNQNPTISNSGLNGNSILQFGIPRAPSISVGSITTLLNNEPATISNVGANGDVVLDFGIPAGKGITGITDNQDGTITILYGDSLSTLINMSVEVVASDVAYSNTTSGMIATTVQAAIDEIDATLGNLSADAVDIIFDNTLSGMTSTNVQTAIEEIKTDISENAFVIKRQEFVSSLNQTLFTLTNGSYTPGANRLSVYIWGVKQNGATITETSSTSFTMPSGLEAGDRIMAEWIEAVNIPGLYQGHSATHGIGGGDTITPAMIGADFSVFGTVKPTNGASMWYEEVF